ncbi:hypothetical protein [Erythrobacter sp. R86502]|uniref:hypothetical protein n=1 Tax=Erythrobacter sp. R86502 TaxID=3093846 RepID=UPI0036D2C1BA
MAAIFTGRDLIVDFEENPASGADHQYRIEYQCANSTVVHYVANSDFRAVDAQGNRQYVDTLTYEENRAAGLIRTPTVRLFTQNANGKWSAPLVVQANNPQPTLPSTPTVTPTVNGVVVNITRPQDNDVVGYRIWRSASSPVARTDANLVFDGPDTSPTIPLPNLGNFFIVVAPYDGFDMQGLNVSPEIQVSAASPQAGPIGPSGPPGSTGPSGPALVITKSQPGNFTFSDGVASPASQTVTFTAVRQNVSGPITWTTQPNVGGGTGDTFQITLAQMGVAQVILVTASAGGIVAGSSVSKLADPGADKTGDNIANGIKNQSQWATWPGLTPAILEQNLATAQADAAQSKIDLANAANDGKLTAAEKIGVRERIANISNEFPMWRDRAIEFGVDAGTRDNYTASYNAMITYFNALNISGNNTQNIVRADFQAAFNNYADWRTRVIQAISVIASQRATWAGVTGAGRPEDNADVTSGRTAAAITGQGLLATENSIGNNRVDFGSLTRDRFAAIGGNEADNGNFALGQTGWPTNAGVVVTDANHAFIGDKYFFCNVSGNSQSINTSVLSVSAGERFLISAVAKVINGGTGGDLKIRLRYTDASGGVTGASEVVFTPSDTTYVRKERIGTIPDRTAYCQITILGSNLAGGRSFAVGHVLVQRVTEAGRSLVSSNGGVLGDGDIITVNGVASAFTGQGLLATRNEILPSLGNGSRFIDNLIPDNEYKDLHWWGAASLPNAALLSIDNTWTMPRVLQFTPDRNFDISSQYFTLEVGSTYRIRTRIWNNDTNAGWTGAFWPMLHIPQQDWFSLKHGRGVNPDIADANNAIVANGDTLDQEFYFTPQNNSARQVQFRFKSTARGSHVALQIHITKVSRLGRDFISEVTNMPYTTGAIQTSLGVAAGFTGQGDLATRNAATLPFGGGNAVVNSDFTRGTFGWVVSATDPVTTLGVNLSGPWFGRRNVMYMNRSVLSPGASVDANPNALWNSGPLANAPTLAMPIAPGDRIYARALLAPHRSTGEVWVLIFTRLGHLVESYAATGGKPGGALNGENFGAPVQVISNVNNPDAAYAIIMIRMNGTGESNPYLFFAEPALGKLAPGQTVIPPYTPGRTDPNADVSAFPSGPASAAFNYSSTGVAEAGQFPRGLVYQFNTLSGPLGSGVTWSYRVNSGVVNGISAGGTFYAMGGTGAGTLTVNSLGTNSNEVTVRGVIAGQVVEQRVVLTRTFAPPNNSGGGGGGGGGGGSGSPATASQSSGFAAFNSTSFQTISNELQVTASTTTQKATINLELNATKSMSVRVLVERWNGSSWVAFGGEEEGFIEAGNEGGGGPDPIFNDYSVPAYFSFTRTIAVTAGSNQRIRVRARRFVGTAATVFTTGTLVLEA